MSLQKKKIMATTVSVALSALSFFVFGKTKAILSAVSCIIAGGGVFADAARNIVHGKIFDEKFLMSIAAVGAFAIGAYSEGAAVMILYSLGEMLEDAADEKSRKSINALAEMMPGVAHAEKNGELFDVPPSEIKVGDLLCVKVGERVPVDGKIAAGESFFDTSAVTGESIPRNASLGDEIFGGCINLGSPVYINAEREYDRSAVARILKITESESERKSGSESFITRFAKVYTPCVCIAAVLTALIPSLITGEYTEWLRRALAFLAASCPCALVISVPLTFFTGIGAGSRAGILFKGSAVLEKCAKTRNFAFDKTGTLTKGVFELTHADTVLTDKKRLVSLAASVERFSLHPTASAICDAAGDDFSAAASVTEYPGEGVAGETDAGTVAVGNEKLMRRFGVDLPPLAAQGGVEVFVSLAGKFAGRLILSDKVKNEAVGALGELKKLCRGKLVMLTGDTEKNAAPLAASLGLDAWRSGLLPDEKSSEVGRLAETGVTAFVGDGINDAPSLARADVGFSMGELGSDAAIESSDVVIVSDRLDKLPQAVKLAGRTVRIARENVFFALTVKLAVLVLAFFGAVGMGASVAADVGVMLAAVLNALRAAKSAA